LKPKKIIIYSLVIVLTYFVIRLYTEKPYKYEDLIKLTMTSKDKIKTTSGRYANYGYSILALEHKSKFTIDNCINFVCDRNTIKEIKNGDKLDIMIESYYLQYLEDSKKEIPIFSLNIDNKEMFSPESYAIGQKKQNCRRVALLSILILAIALLNIEKIRPTISWTILITYTILILILVEKKIL
jgi:hypothetical protein